MYFSNTIKLVGLWTITSLLFVSFYSQAQYVFSPSTTLLKNQYLNDLTYDSIAIINNSSTSTLSLKWHLISKDTIGGSYFDLCATGNCFLDIPLTGSFPDIDPNQFGWIGMHFWSGNTEGISKATIFVYDANNPSVGDTLTFILNVAGTNGTNNIPIQNNSLTIYPNPTTDNINILTSSNEQFSIYVYTSSGQKLKHTINNNTISLKGLDSGNYFIVLEDKNENHYTHVIQKTK